MLTTWKFLSDLKNVSVSLQDRVQCARVKDEEIGEKTEAANDHEKSPLLCAESFP